MDKSYICRHRLDVILYIFNCLFFFFLLSYSEELSNFWYCFFLISLPNGEYLILFIVPALSRNSFHSKTSLLIKTLYLLTSPDDKGEIWIIFGFLLLSFVIYWIGFFTNTRFYNKFFSTWQRIIWWESCIVH